MMKPWHHHACPFCGGDARDKNGFCIACEKADEDE